MWLCSDIWGVNARLPLPGDNEIEAALAQQNILCLASGVLGDVHKFYFYAEVRGVLHLLRERFDRKLFAACSVQDAAGALFLAELSLSAANRLSALVKTSAQDKGAAFAALLKQALSRFIAQ